MPASTYGYHHTKMEVIYCRVTPEEEEKMEDEQERKFKRYEELFDKFEDAGI